MSRAVDASGKKTRPETIAAKEKAAIALGLRKEGLTFVEIAKEAGYNSSQAAHDAVRRAIREILREPVTELITLELERLDALWQIQYLNAQSGDVQALSGCMKIMERRAKYLGLDIVPTADKEESAKADPIVFTETILEINETDSDKAAE
jgi:hypothetical protein